jgi:hypothetical protein
MRFWAKYYIKHGLPNHNPSGPIKKNQILKEIGMLTLSKSIKTKGPLHKKCENALETLKSQKKSEIRPGEGGKLITRTPIPHGQSSCRKELYLLTHCYIIWIYFK